MIKKYKVLKNFKVNEYNFIVRKEIPEKGTTPFYWFLTIDRKIRVEAKNLSDAKKKLKNIIRGRKLLSLPKNLQSKEIYWCSKCKKTHKRYRKSDGRKIAIFYEHAEFYEPKTKEFLWKETWKKNWKQAAKEQAKYGAVGLPKKTKRKRDKYSR